MEKKRGGYLTVLALIVVLAAVLWAGTMAKERRSVGIAAKAAGEDVTTLTPITELVLPLTSPFPKEPTTEMTEMTEELSEPVEDPLALLIELPENAVSETVGAEETVDVSAGDPVGRVLELVNDYRGQQGLSALTLDSALCGAASTRARETVSNFSHTRPDGSQWYTVSSLAHGENIVMGTEMDADSAMTKWMNSSGHRANIMDGAYGTLGVGYYSSGREVYWVQLFGY